MADNPEHTCTTARKLIAISGKSGCGNTTVGRLVANRLGFTFVNYTFRQLAEEWGISLAELARRAEQDPQVDRQLDRRQCELAQQGPSVVSSRLALWLLPQAPLKIYLHAPVETRGARIRTREGGRLADQIRRTQQRDQRDTARYRQLYRIDNDNPSPATIILNTEQLSAQVCADIIVASWQIVDGQQLSD